MTAGEIGVAIGLPEPVAGELRVWRARFGDPEAAAIVPHVTLLGPTVVGGADLPAVVRHLARVAAGAPPFALRLTGTGTFQPTSPVVYLAVAAGGGRCGALAAAVRSGPLDVPIRFPFHPHVTLAQNVPPAALDAARDRFAAFDLALPVASFGLYHRGPVGWVRSHEFALGRARDPDPVAVPDGGGQRPVPARPARPADPEPVATRSTAPA